MNLGIIFLTKWFSGLCMDLLIPYLEKKYKATNTRADR